VARSRGKAKDDGTIKKQGDRKGNQRGGKKTNGGKKTAGRDRIKEWYENGT